MKRTPGANLKEADTFTHKNNISMAVIETMRPGFQDLSHPDLLTPNYTTAEKPSPPWSIKIVMACLRIIIREETLIVCNSTLALV